MKVHQIRPKSAIDVLQFLEDSVQEKIKILDEPTAVGFGDDDHAFERGVVGTLKWVKQQISLAMVWSGLDYDEETVDIFSSDRKQVRR